jgi:hypothetical protein
MKFKKVPFVGGCIINYRGESHSVKHAAGLVLLLVELLDKIYIYA